MRTKSYILGLVSLVLLAQVGCQKFNHEENMEIAPGAIETRVIEAPQREQKVEVTIDSSPAAVSAYLEVLEGADKTPKLLSKKQKSKQFTLSATIPAKTGYQVRIANGESTKTTVKLKIVGQ